MSQHFVVRTWVGDDLLLFGGLDRETERDLDAGWLLEGNRWVAA